MILLRDAVEKKKLDSRIVEKNLTKGVIQQSEYDHFIKTLPDDTVNAEWVSLDSLVHEESSSANNGGKRHLSSSL